MPYEIERVLRAYSQTPLFIDADKARQIAELMAMRAEGHTLGMEAPEAPSARVEGQVAVVPLVGTILPRADMLSAMSGAQSLASFQSRFREAAENDAVRAIVIEVDSPGGQIDLVPETAAMIRSHRREGRPIVAVANTMAASAAYWIACAADEVVVTPSGMVGSIGVFVLHQDVSDKLAAEGVRIECIRAGARKAETIPFAPLSEEARAHLTAQVRGAYDMFVRDVAHARGVSTSVVRADPESAEQHFGGGRAYSAADAVRLGMADRVATLAETTERLGRPSRRRRGARARLI